MKNYSRIFLVVLALLILSISVSAASYFNTTDNILIDLYNGAYITILTPQYFMNNSELVIRIYNSTDTPASTLEIWFAGTYHRWTSVTNITLDLSNILVTPLNNSESVTYSPTTFLWYSTPVSIPNTIQVSTDSQFINIITTTTSTSTTGWYITTINLNPDTDYYWRTKNTTGSYSSWFNFSTIITAISPGQFNISVYDEANLSKQIINYTLQLYNSTSSITKTSNSSTGWTNFSGAEVLSGEYLLVATPLGTFNNYYPRMVLSTSPANVTMYVPNSTSPNIIDLVSFSLLDVTGMFPFQTSTITLSKGGLTQDKSYFSGDGTHPVYLLQGTNYQIVIQYGDNIQTFDNYVPIASGTSQITINDFSVNTTSLDPFQFNISTSPTAVTLNWNDVGGVLSSLNFTVRNLTSGAQICGLVTSVGHGQSVCGINNQSAFQTIFSAKLTDGTFMNQTMYIDFTTGVRKSTTGTSPIDGSPMGIGFKFDYGTFTMPDYVYTWISLILFVLLMGTFGAQFSGFGAIIAGAEMLFFEYVGWFNPLGDTDPSNVITMGLTGVLTIFAVLYFMQHRERGG